SSSLNMQSTSATTTAMASRRYHHHHHHTDQRPLVNHNAPQCCHCGWRGSHAPQCPFR
ncbi:hypothetical protein EDC04DRAFT_2572637, partial [Pisolithus marmoratus]